MTRMLDTLYFRLADVTGREVDEIREDARRGRTLTTGQAIGYGLIQGQETASRPPVPGGPPRPGPAGSPPALTRAVGSAARRPGPGAEVVRPRSWHWSGMLRKLPSVHARSQSVTSNRGLSRLDEKV